MYNTHMEKEPTSVLEVLGLYSEFNSDKGEQERREITEKYFGTQNDPDQIPINRDSLEKFYALSSYCLNCAYEGDKPVSWTVSIPTSLKLMNDFLEQRITEKELFNQTQTGDNEALYICSAFTVPEFRGKGIAKVLLTEQTQAFLSDNPNMEVFTWIWSNEGDKLVKSLPDEIADKVKFRT